MSVRSHLTLSVPLQRKNTLTVKELQVKLAEYHPRWKLPTRRVRKFLKRHLNNHHDPSGADDDATVLTVKGTAPGKRFLKLFKRKDKSKSMNNNVGTIPEVVPTMSQSSTTTTTTTPDKSAATQSPNVGAILESPTLKQNRSLEQTYSDDNDGTKQNHCSCFWQLLAK